MEHCLTLAYVCWMCGSGVIVRRIFGLSVWGDDNFATGGEPTLA